MATVPDQYISSRPAALPQNPSVRDGEQFLGSRTPFTSSRNGEMTDHRKRVTLQIDKSRRKDSRFLPGGLPDDLRKEAAQRLALFCGIGAGTWTIAVIMENVLRPTSVPTPFPWPGN